MTTDRTGEDWELLAQVSQAYRTLSDNFMDRIGMHRAQASLLCRLFVNNGMTQSEIAEQLSVQGATVTNILQRLEEAGLVTRQRDSEDNRLVRVYLTEAGRQKERAITEQFLKLEGTIFEGMNENDRVRMRSLLQQMLQNMSAKT
ncbi:MAG TPA: MarR family transcriptional regulator [Anaerolineales bacterium]|nr:MarR family transcriptional regulator [Anaerolineales bacterium]